MKQWEATVCVGPFGSRHGLRVGVTGGWVVCVLDQDDTGWLQASWSGRDVGLGGHVYKRIFGLDLTRPEVHGLRLLHLTQAIISDDFSLSSIRHFLSLFLHVLFVSPSPSFPRSFRDVLVPITTDPRDSIAH